MAIGSQGGHMGDATATSADQIRVNPYSSSGGIKIGNVHAGNKFQNPKSEIGGNHMSTNFDLSMPIPTGGGELMNLQGMAQ